MRTTVRLDDALMKEVKRVAAQEGLTVTAVLETALREMLARRRQARSSKRVRLPTFKGKGLQPGVDLDDTAALLEVMERTDDTA